MLEWALRHSIICILQLLSYASSAHSMARNAVPVVHMTAFLQACPRLLLLSLHHIGEMPTPTPFAYVPVVWYLRLCRYTSTAHHITCKCSIPPRTYGCLRRRHLHHM